MSSSTVGLFTSWFFAGAGVLEGDEAFGEGLVFEEGKFTLREAAGEEREAFADQDGNDSDIKLVDQVVFEEVTGEFAAAHQPDIFPGTLAKVLDESFRGLIDEGDAAALAGRLRMGEDVALCFRVAECASHFESIVVGFTPHDHGIDGGEKRAHRIVLGHEEKIDRSIGAGDVAIEADAEAEDDLAHGGILNRGWQVFQFSRPAKWRRAKEACRRREKDCAEVRRWSKVRCEAARSSVESRRRQHVTESYRKTCCCGDVCAWRARQFAGANAESLWIADQLGKCQESGGTGIGGSSEEQLERRGSDRRSRRKPCLLREDGQHATRQRECGHR